jgi:hypothetical protein
MYIYIMCSAVVDVSVFVIVGGGGRGWPDEANRWRIPNANKMQTHAFTQRSFTQKKAGHLWEYANTRHGAQISALR